MTKSARGPALSERSESKGFTLIELLVVISIIAILSTIGATIFTGTQAKARDAKRRVDIDAIVKALEVKKGTNYTYQSISGSDFSGGSIPKEPTNRTQKYCAAQATAAFVDPTPPWGTACPAGAWNNLDAIGSGIYTIASTITYIKVCTLDEAQTGVICYNTRQ